MDRDLTNAFIRSRSFFHPPKASFAAERGGGDGQDSVQTQHGVTTLLGSADASVDTSSLSPSEASSVYLGTVNELQTDFASITTRLESMMRLCDQRASTINFDPKANAEKDREIEVVIVELTRTFNAAAKRLERLNRLVSIGCADTQEIKLLGYIVSGSARRKRDLLMDFFKQCLRARKQLLDGSGSGSILGATEGGGGGSSAELKEGITDALLLDFFKQCLGARKQLLDGSGSGSILGATEGGGGASSAELKEGITDAETNELATAETEVNERMQETQRIAKSVEDLAMLLKDLNTLVVDQGSLGDRIDFMMDIPIRRVCGPIFYDKIEYNTEITLPGCGKIVLNKSRLSRCILTLVVLIVIMTIIIIVRNTPQTYN